MISNRDSVVYGIARELVRILHITTTTDRQVSKPHTEHTTFIASIKDLPSATMGVYSIL